MPTHRDRGVAESHFAVRTSPDHRSRGRIEAVTDLNSTPPVGIVGLKRAIARQGGPAYRVVVADDPQPWSDAETPATLSQLAPAQSLAGFERLAEDGATVLVVCGRRQAPGVARAVAMARTALEARIGLVSLPVGPLGQYALARIAEQVLSHDARPAGLLVEAMPRLASALVDVGLVRSVTALDLPGITLGHHLSSYLPGSRQYAVQLTPEPLVARVSEGTPVVAGPEGFARADFGAGGARLLRAGPHPVPTGMTSVWVVAGPGDEIPTRLDLTGFWHDETATEFVVIPADPVRWISDQLTPGPTRSCPWCAEKLAASARSCLFCGYTPDQDD